MHNIQCSETSCIYYPECVIESSVVDLNTLFRRRITLCYSFYCCERRHNYPTSNMIVGSLYSYVWLRVRPNKAPLMASNRSEQIFGQMPGQEFPSRRACIHNVMKRNDKIIARTIARCLPTSSFRDIRHASQARAPYLPLEHDHVPSVCVSQDKGNHAEKKMLYVIYILFYLIFVSDVDLRFL